MRNDGDSGKPVDNIDRAMSALVASGDVQPPRLSRSGWPWKPQGIGLDPDMVTKLLDDLRADRWQA